MAALGGAQAHGSLTLTPASAPNPSPGDAFETDDNFTFAEDGPIEEMDELDTEGGV
jgi:hypothetical protein